MAQFIDEEKKKLRVMGQPKIAAEPGKVPSIYAEGTPTRRIADRNNAMFGESIKPYVDTADKALGLAQRFSGAIGGNVLKKGVERLQQDATTQKIATDTYDRKKLREGLGKQFPDGRVLYSNAPVKPTPENSPELFVKNQVQSVQQPQAQTGIAAPPVSTNSFSNVPEKDRVVKNVGVQYSPQDTAVKNSLGAIDARLAQMAEQGIQVTPEQTAQINNIRQQAGFLRGGTDRVPLGPDGRPARTIGNVSRVQQIGNLDVQFDPSVSQQARQAFTANPVRPTAQIDRFAANKKAEEAYFAQKAADIRAQNPVLAAADQAAVQAQIEREKLGIARENTGISRMTAESTGKVQAADVEGKQFTLAQQKEVQALQKAHAEAPDDKTRAAIERQMRGYGIKFDKPEIKIATEEGTDADGNPYKIPYAVNNENPQNSFRIGGNGGGKELDFSDAGNSDVVSYLKNIKNKNPKEYERLKAEYMAKQR